MHCCVKCVYAYMSSYSPSSSSIGGGTGCFFLRSSFRSSGQVELSLSQGRMQSKSKQWSLWHGSCTTSGYSSLRGPSQPRTAGRLTHASTGNHKLTFEERVDADGACVGRLEALFRHTLQLIQEAVWHALELRWRVVCVLSQHLNHVRQQIMLPASLGLVVRRSSAHHLEGVGQQPKGRRHVLGLGHRIGVGVCLRIRRVHEFELREESGQIWPAGRLLRPLVLVGDVVLDCALSVACRVAMT
jgi:hypothetical protein